MERLKGGEEQMSHVWGRMGSDRGGGGIKKGRG